MEESPTGGFLETKVISGDADEGNSEELDDDASAFFDDEDDSEDPTELK